MTLLQFLGTGQCIGIAMARKPREREQSKAHRLLIEHNVQRGMPFMDAGKKASLDLPETMRMILIKPDA